MIKMINVYIYILFIPYLKYQNNIYNWFNQRKTSNIKYKSIETIYGILYIIFNKKYFQFR